MSDRVEALLRMHDEHANQARQHEDQRASMTNLILLVAGALVTFVSYNGLKADSLVASIAMIGLGTYGCLFSLKHYERNRLHVTVLRAFRDEMDQELNSTRPRIGDVEEQGRYAHKSDFGKTDLRRWVMNFGLHTLWAGF